MNTEQREAIIKDLTRAYWLEMETTVNYLAISVDLDGIRAEEIKKTLAADIQAELTHAKILHIESKKSAGECLGPSPLPQNKPPSNRPKIQPMS